ncbi:hypothetical protein F8M41_009761 [Gigaspora margarita]|uniref:Uncharacterized protein n=1 Tax=Gigaspora margarita TaxID=4874 RepID=A0A8H4AUZ9_GIGMA|nr:hypothetical protein F8M41_009761 [Gigaspora margarita]
MNDSSRGSGLAINDSGGLAIMNIELDENKAFIYYKNLQTEDFGLVIINMELLISHLFIIEVYSTNDSKEGSSLAIVRMIWMEGSSLAILSMELELGRTTIKHSKFTNTNKSGRKSELAIVGIRKNENKAFVYYRNL